MSDRDERAIQARICEVRVLMEHTDITRLEAARMLFIKWLVRTGRLNNN